ncbi:MAG: hypothetical protein M3243_01335 [Thermoproteota archaeon]|nr:hypothetical protein [Thermoproteota archaeon]
MTHTKQGFFPWNRKLVQIHMMTNKKAHFKTASVELKHIDRIEITNRHSISKGVTALCPLTLLAFCYIIIHSP